MSFKKHFCEIIWNQAIVLETGMFYFSFIFLFSFFRFLAVAPFCLSERNHVNKKDMVALVRSPEYHMNQEYSSYLTLFNAAKRFEQF